MAQDYLQVNSYTRYLLTLGLKDDATYDTCHAAYLNLLKQWHPDRFGFDDPKRVIAEQKTKEITGAFERLKRLKFLDQITPSAEHLSETAAQNFLYEKKLERLQVKVELKN